MARTYAERMSAEHLPQTSAEHHQAGQKAVKQLDTNKDGVVDKTEFAAAGGTEEEFIKYDTNKDVVLDTRSQYE